MLNPDEELVSKAQLDMLQEELNEEKALHEKTNRQLIEVTQLAEEAMDYENEAKKELEETQEEMETLKAELEMLRSKDGKKPKISDVSVPKRKSVGEKKKEKKRVGEKNGVVLERYIIRYFI